MERAVTFPVRTANPLVVCCVMLGCHIDAYDAIPASARPPDPLVVSLEATERRMHTRYGSARSMVDAIARSDLEGAHAKAHVVAVLNEPDALPAWRPYIVAVQRAAQDVEHAGSLATAARAAAVLGMRCAGCHDAIQAQVALAEERRPSRDPKLSQEMLGHHWAELELWNGLMAPSNDHWRRGGAALSELPVDIVAQSQHAGIADDVDDTARVRAYGRRALAAQTHGERADVYGDLLAACAHCHQTLRDR